MLDLANKEEARFRLTLDRGLNLLESIIQDQVENGVINGHQIFTLYDTHGLPPELTQEVAKLHDFDVDMS